MKIEQSPNGFRGSFNWEKKDIIVKDRIVIEIRRNNFMFYFGGFASPVAWFCEFCKLTAHFDKTPSFLHNNEEYLELLWQTLKEEEK